MSGNFSTLHRARKRFGQNFLHDQFVIDRIITSIQPSDGVPVIEIGPGQGALTAPLLAATNMLAAIEIDRDLARQLRIQFPQLRLVEADVLQTRLPEIIKQHCHDAPQVKVVGNLPYNISTPLIFHLLVHANRIQAMYFMLQREVVERMAAQPGSKTYGKLSVMVQYHCDVTPLFHIAAHAFQPAPKVESTLVLLKPRPFPAPLHNVAHFEKLVSAAFQQRRKTLRNALGKFLPTEIPEDVHAKLSLRAETLSVTDYVAMSNAIFSSAPAGAA
jgi:16S rRNA (adenine1518-N6/adenine1519-N6)-dimethyltransferase